MDGRSGDVVVGGALDDMVVVVSVVSLKGNNFFDPAPVNLLLLALEGRVSLTDPNFLSN